ncbi:hypothetical protein [Veronia nyctiphanis]|uniref:hypothetical protein n=1 Tax=Veronia nyctiphanis TaxID=1278244 RepID=UPI00100A8F56|nr:hypothetical protein [Veronia nyctiphanis]
MNKSDAVFTHVDYFCHAPLFISSWQRCSGNAFATLKNIFQIGLLGHLRELRSTSDHDKSSPLKLISVSQCTNWIFDYRIMR